MNLVHIFPFLAIAASGRDPRLLEATLPYMLGSGPQSMVLGTIVADNQIRAADRQVERQEALIVDEAIKAMTHLIGKSKDKKLTKAELDALPNLAKVVEQLGSVDLIVEPIVAGTL